MLRRASALDLSVGPFFLRPAHMAGTAQGFKKDQCLQDLLSVFSSSPTSLQPCQSMSPGVQPSENYAGLTSKTQKYPVQS